MNNTFDNIHAQFASFNFGTPAQPAATGPAEASSRQVEHPLRSALSSRKSSADLLSGGASPSAARVARARINLITEKVKAALAVPLVLTRDEQAVVDGGFMLPRHVRGVSIALDVMNAACSFCHTGEWTLRKIDAGAEAKGHDTLDKTLKPASIRAAFPADEAERILRDAEAADILGYVATLNPGKCSGTLVMGSKVRDFAESDDPRKAALGRALVSGPNGRLEYPVDFANLEASLATLKAVENWERLPLTGDYDLHEMLLIIGSRPHTVASNSVDEATLIAAVNAGISAADQNLRPHDDPNMNLVKHGPQVSYVAYMKAEEAGTPLTRAVAEPRFPLTMYIAKREWTSVENTDDLNDMYRKCRAVMKQSWAPRGSISFEGSDDNVTLTRRSSAASVGSGGPSRRGSVVAPGSGGPSRRSSAATVASGAPPRRDSATTASSGGPARRTSLANVLTRK
ncbi:hypothetical protein HR51_32645 [Burkholderia cepacia]|nr:hypothetical protein HR51_32645 [Burkholderia cepacia]